MLKIEIFHNFIMIIGVKGVVLSDKSLFLTLFSIGNVGGNAPDRFNMILSSYVKYMKYNLDYYPKPFFLILIIAPT